MASIAALSTAGAAAAAGAACAAGVAGLVSAAPAEPVSALCRYDVEHAFRVEIAQLAAARHWLEQALQGGHLVFLRQAHAQLAAAGLSELGDIIQAYDRRCGELAANTH